MEWPNFNHLFYFWTVASEGSVTGAAERLMVAQPTVSEQIRALERSVGQKLFRRAGRGIALTDTGEIVYRYADEMFAIGRELAEFIDGHRAATTTLRVRVGIANVLPKTVVSRLLQPVFALKERVRISCTEGSVTELISQLSMNRLDVVLSDAPVDPHLKVQAFNALLGESRTLVFAPAAQAAKFSRGFPKSLEAAPFLVPTDNTILRRRLDLWFEKQGIRPSILGEFEDSALLKVLAQARSALFVGPAVIQRDIESQFGVQAIGEVDTAIEQFYAISVDRRFAHPAVAAITATARKSFFSGAPRRD
ncbi:MAG: transcriptional activator NhaR [Phycisphaerales bacterium]|nr:transcriptional activator NhaR [Phycisphaerales bacterium]